jgi:hypothetical protein
MLGRFLVRGVVVAGFSIAVGAGVGCTQLDTVSTTGDGTLDPGASFVSNAQAPVVKNSFVRDGVSWSRESVHPIMWDVPNDLGRLDDFVTVSMSTDGGAQYTPLDQITASDRYYRWTLPAQGGDKTRFRVTFHRTDDQGNITALRHLDTPEVTLLASQKKKYVWTEVAKEAPFGPRDGAGGVVFGGKMWLLGGWNPGVFSAQCANDVWSSKDGATWVQERPNTFKDPNAFDHKKDWEGRHYAGYHVFGGQMWIVGGDPLQGRYQTDSWSSTDGKTWTRRDVHTTEPRMITVTDPASPYYGQTIVDTSSKPVEVAQFGKRTVPITGVFAGKLFLMGGQRMQKYVDPEWPGAPATAFNDIWQSTDGSSFSQVAVKGPVWSPRGFVSEAVEHDGRMWVIGGGLTDDPLAGRKELTFNRDVWTTRDGVTWEENPTKAPFSPRFWHNVKVFDGRIWVINGYDGPVGGQGRQGDNLGDVWYSTDGTNWYEAKTPQDFVPRHAGTAWVHAGAIFIGSGNAIGADPKNPAESKWFADVWKMSPAP